MPIEKRASGREIFIPLGHARRSAARATSSRSKCCAKAGFGLPSARVVERLGAVDTERAVSLIALAAHDIPHVFSAADARRSRRGQARDARPSRGLARPAARHHRPRRRQGPRRRRARRARRRPRQSRRLRADRRDRRRRLLRAAGLRARQGSAGARQFGLFPRPRRADAARAHLQRPVLAARRRGPARARGAHDRRRRRAQEAPHVPPHHDALGRQALLRAGAARDRRPPDETTEPLLETVAEAALGGL